MIPTFEFGPVSTAFWPWVTVLPVAFAFSPRLWWTWEMLLRTSEVCEMLAQRSRPQLFSNALPPTVACSALEAVRVLRREPDLPERLRELTRDFRSRLRELGFDPLDGEAAIVPVIVGETEFAIRFSERLLDEGVFVTGFGFPVVPEGTARIRVQLSAALQPAHLDRALEAFERVGSELGVRLR